MTTTTFLESVRRESQALRLLGAMACGLSLAPDTADAASSAAGYLRTRSLGAAGDAAVEVLQRAGAEVGAIPLSSSLPTGDGTSAVLLAVRQLSAFASLPGVLRVAMGRGEVFAQVSRAVGYVTREGQSLPMQALPADSVSMTPITSRAAIIVSRELLRAIGSANEQALGIQLASAVASAYDEHILNAVPAGETTAADDGTAASIDAALLDAVTWLSDSVGLQGARWVIPQVVLANLMLLRSGDAQAYASLPGSLAGLPVSVTQASSTSTAGQQLLLVSPSSIVLSSDEALQVGRAEHASVEMSSAPTADSLTPTATSTVSLWQSNSAAIYATLTSAWAGASRGIVRVGGL